MNNTRPNSFRHTRSPLNSGQIWPALACGVLLLLALLWMPETVRAGTYYLAPTGDDAGDGSKGRPWKTLRHATSEVPDDGSTIMLLDGLYSDSHSVSRLFDKRCTVRAEHAYRARLRSPDNSNRAFSCFQGRNLVFEGLEIFGSGDTRGDYLVQISTPRSERLTFVDCIIHDSYKNDLVKVNDRARDILFRRCIFFNQNDHAGDEHLDINTVTDIRVEDSIFFNDFPGSGRPLGNQAHSFVVIKNSGSTPDITQRIAFRRNIFLNWQGKVDQCYLLLGEDGKPFFEAQDVVIEDNLFLHNSPVRFWGTLLLKGGLKNIVFRANTVLGHPNIKWSGAYAAACFRVGENPPMEGLAFSNNIWCDSGQMPRFSFSKDDVFAKGRAPLLLNNLYWNGGKPIPSEPGDTLAPASDRQACFGDPKLGDPNTGLTLPRWDSARGAFLSGAGTIRAEFERLVGLYAIPGKGSAAIGAADPASMPPDDILGNPRGRRPDIGCCQRPPAPLPRP